MSSSRAVPTTGRPRTLHRELGDLLAELAVAELHGRAERRRQPVRLRLGDAALGHAPQRVDAGVEPAEVRPQPGVVPRSAVGAGSAAPADEPAELGAQRDDVLRERGAALEAERHVRDPPAVVLVADAVRSPAPARSSRNTSQKWLSPSMRPHRADLHPRLVHVEDQPGDALVLGRVRVGAHEQLAVVGDVGPRAPDLLAADDVLVAVAHRPGAQARRGPSRPGARRSPGTTRGRPAGSAAGALGAAPRCPRRSASGRRERCRRS